MQKLQGIKPKSSKIVLRVRCEIGFKIRNRKKTALED